MRQTRRSAAAAEDAPTTTAEPGDNNDGTLTRAQQRALDRLRIDANDALKGDKVKKENEAQVYYYKGAAYVVDENTKAEWLEAQPERYLKRKRNAEAEDEDVAEQEQESVLEPPAAKRKRGRPRKNPLPDEPVLRKNERSVLGKRKDTASQHAASPRKRGRPCKNAVRREESDNDEQSEREDEDDNEFTATTTTRKTRSQAERPIKELKKRRDLGAAAAAAKQKAKEQGLKVEPISWPDKVTGDIARNLVKFLAIQSRVRKVKQEYDEAAALYERIKERDRALEEQLNGDEARNDSPLGDNVVDATQLDKQAPLTPPEAELDDHNHTPKSYVDKRHDHDYNQQESFVRGEQRPVKQTALKADATQKPDKDTTSTFETGKTRSPPKVLDRAALCAGQPSGIRPGDPLPDRDQAGNKLDWSLMVAQDMEGRAEFHISSYRLPRETEAERAERHHRELLIIADWEVIDPKAAILVHNGPGDRARVPRKRSREDDDFEDSTAGADQEATKRSKEQVTSRQAKEDAARHNKKQDTSRHGKKTETSYQSKPEDVSDQSRKEDVSRRGKKDAPDQTNKKDMSQQGKKKDAINHGDDQSISQQLNPRHFFRSMSHSSELLEAFNTPAPRIIASPALSSANASNKGVRSARQSTEPSASSLANASSASERSARQSSVSSMLDNESEAGGMPTQQSIEHSPAEWPDATDAIESKRSNAQQSMLPPIKSWQHSTARQSMPPPSTPAGLGAASTLYQSMHGKSHPFKSSTGSQHNCLPPRPTIRQSMPPSTADSTSKESSIKKHATPGRIEHPLPPRPPTSFNWTERRQPPPPWPATKSSPFAQAQIPGQILDTRPFIPTIYPEDIEALARSRSSFSSMQQSQSTRQTPGASPYLGPKRY
ncbi:hypothetical protein AMS68_002128 [Peltaster fructicola]|uniref:Uncharacterized protein n=1 Tax=Peltaster fructicola TaxID=286661 RepID=A0A6H0XPN4_9PEZI|nr:hypothetical protein AMS68_002128 [Peltaster fructicola]